MACEACGDTGIIVASVRIGGVQRGERVLRIERCDACEAICSDAAAEQIGLDLLGKCLASFSHWAGIEANKSKLDLRRDNRRPRDVLV